MSSWIRSIKIRLLPERSLEFEAFYVKGLIFSIEEFAVHDGEGLRTAVFFKGCPLRCRWCHNPEGLLPKPQRIRNNNGCLHCGRCEQACSSRKQCIACGQCAAYCPRGLIRIAGEYWEAAVLAARVKRNFPCGVKGGVTLSGGEVFMQPEFLLELLEYLRPLHRAIETSAYCTPDIFSQALKKLEFVFMDVKLMDDQLHQHYTGVSNRPVLENLEVLKSSGIPFVIRIPMIAGVNDSFENAFLLGKRLSGCPGLQAVELLPYNTMAGAKYSLLGWKYKEKFESPETQKLEQLVDVFSQMKVPARYRKQV